ncbi:MAG: hypothetical protein II272_02615 [Oscillospiraceae bacterium]|nr:hypothetical protein [Oscillospiraceae bacterium]
MCYILYGAADPAIHPGDHKKACQASEYAFPIGTKHDVKMAIVKDSGDYRVTQWICDCDFPTGKHDPTAKELLSLAKLIQALKEARNAKCLYLAKAWTGESCKTEERVHIKDLDLPTFLAELKERCLYRIDLYPSP